MNVFKFGGASVKDAGGIQNVIGIMNCFPGEKIAVVVSATGKTTNALEDVVKSYFAKDGMCFEKLEHIKNNHIEIVNALGLQSTDVAKDINDLFVEIDWILEEEPNDPYDYVYDQIVSIGELVSSRILHHAMVNAGIKADWLDVRGVLFTDDVHREAKVIWPLTTEKVSKSMDQLMKDYDVVVTQGFIGSTQENHTTTLGREGSDYTAAILSYCCDAEAMHIWKDVPGVLTADPKKFNNVSKIDKLSYKEAIEMTYYGAKVIHPKTIKPLQNKNIPLFVRPFDNPKSTGTKISAEGEGYYPPIVVAEEDQALVSISVKDFSFVAEQHLSNIFGILSELRIKVNMMRNTAISFTLCVNHHQEKLKLLKLKLGDEFSVTTETDLEMITIRHFTTEVIQEMKRSKLTMFEDRLQDTIQLVVKEIPLISRKSE